MKRGGVFAPANGCENRAESDGRHSKAMVPGQGSVCGDRSVGDRMSNIELETPSVLSQLWPAVLIPVGLGLTVVWVCFLAYGLIELALLAIRIAA